MSRRWSDAQYTGRYLRRTIVHGKGEARSKRENTTGSQNKNGLSNRVWVLFILCPLVLIILYFVSIPVFCVAALVYIWLLLAVK